MARPWHAGRGGGRVSETLGEFTFFCCLPSNPHSSNREMLIQSIKGTWWPAEQVCSCVWSVFRKNSHLILYQLNYSTCQGFTGTFLWAWQGSSTSPVLPEQQTGIAAPPRCSLRSWDMGQGFSYPFQADLCVHPATAAPPGLVAQDPWLRFKALQHLRKAMADFGGCWGLPHSCQGECFTCLLLCVHLADRCRARWCVLVPRAGFCTWPWRECASLTPALEEQVSWWIVQHKCSLESALCIHCCGNAWEALAGVILLEAFLVCIPQSWVQLLLWLKLHQTGGRGK